MNYVMWWVTDKGFGLEAMFDNRGFAQILADALNAKAIEGGVHYEVTKAGETPVW